MKGNKKKGFAWGGARALGILALAFGLVLAGCDDPNSGGKKTNDDPELTGAIHISDTNGGAAVTAADTGDTLHAVWTAGEGAPDVSYQWNKGEDAISGGTNETYTPSAAGSYTVTVSAEGYQSKTSGTVAVTGDSVWLPATTRGSGTITRDFYGVAYGGGKWVAVGRYGRIATSDNGIDWSVGGAVTPGGDGIVFGDTIDDYIYGVAYGSNKFVAVGSRGKIATSSDGTSRTAVGNANGDFGTSYIYGVAYGGASGQEKWVAVGQSGKMAYFSDGTSWTTVGDSKFGSSQINGVAYGGGKFVAVGYGGKIAHSSDGMSWTAATTTNSGFSTDTINGVAYGGTGANAKWVAVGNGKIATSTDGISWTAATTTSSGFSTDTINGVAYGGTGANAKWVAVGRSGKIATSADGTSWTAVTTTSSGFSTNSISGVAYGGGKWVAVGSGGKIAYCED